jgi:hypothetical protein
MLYREYNYVVVHGCVVCVLRTLIFVLCSLPGNTGTGTASTVFCEYASGEMSKGRFSKILQKTSSGRSTKRLSLTPLRIIKKKIMQKDLFAVRL